MAVRNLVQDEVKHISFELDGVGENGVEKKQVSVDFVKFKREGLTPVYAAFVKEDNQVSKKDLEPIINGEVDGEMRSEKLHPTQITLFVKDQDGSFNRAHFGEPEFGKGFWTRLEDKPAEIGDLEQAIAKGLTSKYVQEKALDLEKEDALTTQDIRAEYKKMHNIS